MLPSVMMSHFMEQFSIWFRVTWWVLSAALCRCLNSSQKQLQALIDQSSVSSVCSPPIRGHQTSPALNVTLTLVTSLSEINAFAHCCKIMLHFWNKVCFTRGKEAEIYFNYMNIKCYSIFDAVCNCDEGKWSYFQLIVGFRRRTLSTEIH